MRRSGESQCNEELDSSQGKGCSRRPPLRRSRQGGPRTQVYISHPTVEHLCFIPEDQKEGTGEKMICNAPAESATFVIQTQINGGKGNGP